MRIMYAQIVHFPRIQNEIEKKYNIVNLIMNSANGSITNPNV